MMEVAARRHREVVIVYRSLPHYRVDFYNGLRKALAERGISLRLIVGQPVGDDRSKNDIGSVGWEEVVRNRVFRLGRRIFVWQPVLAKVRGADLVIVEQANKLLINPLLMVWRRVGGPRLGQWGHGYNHDGVSASRLSEMLKRTLLRQCDWFFAYTEGTARYAISAGMSSERVTAVQNAIDTEGLAALCHELSPDDSRPGHVAAFVGSLYDAKRLEFLFEACDHLRRRLTDFELIVVGDGPQRGLVESAAASRPWIRFQGALVGVEMVAAVARADLILMPGLVGLVILDSFALEKPMITTAVENHSPEIDYLVSGINGIMLARSVSAEEYAEAVAAVWANPELLERLRDGCRHAASKYTVSAMVERFASGIQAALGRAERGE